MYATTSDEQYKVHYAAVHQRTKKNVKEKKTMPKGMPGQALPAKHKWVGDPNRNAA